MNYFHLQWMEWKTEGKETSKTLEFLFFDKVDTRVKFLSKEIRYIHENLISNFI
jgi:hypothetical protein